MFVVKVLLITVVFFFSFLLSHGLDPLASEETTIIRSTETIVRNITNTLFAQLNLRGTKVSKKIRRFITVHNFLVSNTLQDHKNLNKIVRLSRCDKRNVKNETENLIELLNEILDANLNVSDYIYTAPNKNIIKYAKEFLTKLDGLKESSELNNDYESLEIKDEIIDILLKNKTEKFNASHNDVKANSERDLLEDEFWSPRNTRRIYRGKKTKIRHFPFMASIQFFKKFQCGGSIIKSDLVVTAASCLQLAWNNRFFRENPAFLSVRVGTNFYNGGGESIPVLEVYFHPEYNPKNLRHNIAVLRLHRHLKFRKNKSRLKKINIDRQDHALPMMTDGITVVGWGAKGSSNVLRDPWENQIAFAVLDVYGLQECQEVYSKEFVTQKNFCAGFISKGGGACNHDVGGPGVANGILVGVISFGSPVCGTPDAPTVFTKVGFYAEWIDEIMDQKVPVKHTRTTLQRPHLDLSDYPAHLLVSSLVPILSTDEPTTAVIPNNEDKESENLKNEDDLNYIIDALLKSQEYENLTIDDNGPNIKKQERTLHVETENSMKDLSKKLKKKSIGLGASDLIKDMNTLSELSDFESVTKKSKHYTKLDVDSGSSDETDSIEENIAKLLDNIDLTSEFEESAHVNNEMVASITRMELYPQTTTSYKVRDTIGSNRKEFKGTKKYIDNIDNNIKGKKDKKNDDIQKEDVLTLLYLSDDEEEGGLSIAIDDFQDTNTQNNISNAVLELVSKSQLTELLNDAINDMTEIKKNKDL